MGIALTDDHRELAEVARAFLTSQKARWAARSLLDSPDESRPPFWQDMVELGWLGLHIDERHGGSGYGLPELVVVVEELGRAVAPGPFVPTVIASAVLAKKGSDEQQTRLLPGLIDGTVTAGIGLDGNVRVENGVASGDAGIVLGAGLAELLLVAAGDDVLVLDRGRSGVSVEAEWQLRVAAGDELPMSDGREKPEEHTITTLSTTTMSHPQLVRDDEWAETSDGLLGTAVFDATGDKAAMPSWDELVRQHADRVYRLAYRLSGNQQDAEDLTQETFIRVFRSVQNYQPGTFEGWLHRITTNLFLDMVRRRSRIRMEALPEDYDRVPADDPNPEQIYHDSRLGPDLQAALDSLPPEFRAAVVLCDIEGLSYEEIGATLGVKLGTVRSRIHRGRQALRDYLAAHPEHSELSPRPVGTAR